MRFFAHGLGDLYVFSLTFIISSLGNTMLLGLKSVLFITKDLQSYLLTFCHFNFNRIDLPGTDWRLVSTSDGKKYYYNNLTKVWFLYS